MNFRSSLLICGMLLASSTFGIPVDEAPRDEALPDPLIQITTLALNAASGEPCSTDTAFDGGNRKWMGRCQTLDECRDSCEAPGCVAFNWWPGKGGCRHYATADYTKRKTAHVTIGGTPDCASDVAGPTDEMCSSQLLQADSKVSGPSVQYGVWNELDKVPSDCPYELKDLGKIVPDHCCTDAPSVQEPLDFEGKTCKSFRGLPEPTPFIRDYLSCDAGKLTFAETCMPSGTSLGKGYPMATAQDSNSDLEGCGCKKLGALTNGINAIHTGAGCHAAVTSYMLSGGKSSAGGIFFAKLKGSCSAQKPVACSTDTAFDGGNRKWMGRCQTLDECRDSCEAPGCVAFNWWPGKGGCRHYATADYTKRKTAHVTIGGTPDCASDVAGPTDEMCSSQLLQTEK